jgi:hypothetical protein
MIPAEHESDCKLAMKKWRRVVISEFAMKQVDDLRNELDKEFKNERLSQSAKRVPPTNLQQART